MATDPLASTFNPVAVRAPNGIQLDNSAFWGSGIAPYNISLITSPTLVIRGDWDVDLPLTMAQNYYANLTNVPYKRFVQVSEGTHTLLLEKNRMELFQHVQLFLDQEAADTKSTPLASAYASATAASAQLPASGIISTNHYVNSSAAGIQIYVRNKRPASMTVFSSTKTMIMVHGATYPATTAFDLQLNNISVMDFFASHGYDVWSVDIRGYGLSSRPAEMELAANLSGPIVTTADAALDLKSVADYVLGLRGLAQHVAFGWSWGTSTMTRYVTLNPTKVSKLVIYAAQWFRPYAAPPVTAYRTVTRDQAYSRWINGLPSNLVSFYLPGSTFDDWWNATVVTDPTASSRDPPSIRAPNGIQLDNSILWGNFTAPYDIEQIICPVLVVRGDLDLDLNLNMSQSYYNALRVAPLRKFVQISGGTHTLLLERFRFELLREVQLFLDSQGPAVAASPLQSFARTVAVGPAPTGAPAAVGAPSAPTAAKAPATSSASGTHFTVALLATAALSLLVL